MNRPALELVDFDVLNHLQNIPRVRFKCELRLVLDLELELGTHCHVGVLFGRLNSHLYVTAEHIDLFLVKRFLGGVIIETKVYSIICWVKGMNY